MGKFEDYINEVIGSSAAGPYKAGWQIHTLQEDYKRRYGRYPSKSEFLEYGNSIMGGSCTHSKTGVPVNSTSSPTSKNSISQPSEEALKILKLSELNKEKSSDDLFPNVSFSKAYKIWK